MDPVTITQAALLALDGVLQIIAEIRAQGGMTDDQIMTHAQSYGATNQALIAQYLKALPPAS